jgi:methylphosphotriester-DNA--protein-cysteine methyltransferase
MFLVTLGFLALPAFIYIVRITGVYCTEVNFLKVKFRKETLFFDRARQQISRYRLKRLSS